MFEKAEKIAYIYVAPVFYFFGLFGSLANLIILQDQKFNGKIYVYLRGLSLSDLCFLSLIIPFLTFRVQANENVFHSHHYNFVFYESKLQEAFINGFSTTSVFLVVCMTLDRYFAICQPILYSNSKKRSNPIIEVLGSFFTGLLIHIPYCFTSSIKGPKCYFSNESYCNYTAVIHQGLYESSLWKTYVILCQLLIRFVPAILLITLNVLIIKGFNSSLNRKKKLLCGPKRKLSSLKRNASKLLTKPSSFFNKRDLPVIPPVFTIETPSESAPKKLTFLEPILRQKAPSLPSLASIGSTSSRKKKIKDDLTMKRRISISRRKYIKEKSLIITLVFITVMFTISTIPSGIVIIVKQFDPENDLMGNAIFLGFRIIANMLELCNASVNFYMYCLCNRDIRHHVRKMFTSTGKDGGKNESSVGLRSNDVTSKDNSFTPFTPRS